MGSPAAGGILLGVRKGLRTGRVGKGWRRKAEALRGKRRPYRVLSPKESFVVVQSLSCI